MMERRRAPGRLAPPPRGRATSPLPAPAEERFAEFDSGSGRPPGVDHHGLRRLLRNLLRDKSIGPTGGADHPRRGPHVRHGRAFQGLQDLSPAGPALRARRLQTDAYLAEAKDGQILEEGITEAGGHGSFTAAGTAYATCGQPMVPFYIFYSMFGFQRVGDLIWAAADMRARGFLMGATAGRTTLLGEGLQHDDGQSHLLFSVVPNVPGLRPGVRLRDRPPSCATASGACTARAAARTSSTT